MFQAYIISCLIDGKVYVGITSRSLKRRWNEHLYASRKGNSPMTVARAIGKHGPDNFRMESICSARTWADICAVETVLISQYDSRAPNGYNLREGGEGSFGHGRTAESIERSAAKHRGKPCHPNTLAASKAGKGRKKPQDFGAKIAVALTGKIRTEETKAKIRASWAAKRADGAFKTREPYAHHAKIPAPLSRHIARTFRPAQVETWA